jgi:hypothetical protein
VENGLELTMRTVLRKPVSFSMALPPSLVQYSKKEEYLGAIASGEIDYLRWEPGEFEVRVSSWLEA